MELRVTTVSGRSATINLEPDACTLEELAAQVARACAVPKDGRDRLRLVAKGQPVTEAVLRQLHDGDTILAVVAPRPPPQELRQLAEGGEQQEEDEVERFRLRPDAPRWQRQLAHLLQHRLRLPEVLLVLLFSLPARFYLGVVAWLVGSKVASTYGAGPLYMVSSVFVLILLNLGRRREGEWSAYSIFNEGHRRLPGQLTAEHMDDQVRRGHLG